MSVSTRSIKFIYETGLFLGGRLRRCVTVLDRYWWSRAQTAAAVDGRRAADDDDGRSV